MEIDYSTLPLNKFSPKDAKIIRDNPKASLYELTMAGLSQPAQSRLEEMATKMKEGLKDVTAPTGVVPNETTTEIKQGATSEPKTEQIKPDTTTPTPSNVQKVNIQPEKVVIKPTRTYQPYELEQESVTIHNKRTGLTFPMNRRSANKLVKSNPENFSIVG